MSEADATALRDLIAGAATQECTYCHASPGGPCRTEPGGGVHLARFLGLEFGREEAGALERAGDGPFPAGVIWVTADLEPLTSEQARRAGWRRSLRSAASEMMAP